MIRGNRSGFSLVLAGGAGIAFFWLSDPRAWLIGDGIDAANQSRVGTLVGVAGSGLALLIGFWLLTRRTT